MVAPDSFGETLTANQAADAICRGWRRARPADQLTLAPQSDGGPGFVDVLATRLGQIQELDVEGPSGETVRAAWLLDGDAAYIEAATACGLALLGGPPTVSSALKSSSYGVGQLITAAVDVSDVRTIYVGLGGSSCTDGGRGMVGALGGLTAATRKLRDIALIAATDVENPLLGASGAAQVFGPQKGADDALIDRLDELNRQWAAVLKREAGRDVSELSGAGAAGGIGAALFALGGVRESGASVVADRTDQAARLAAVDLVVTGEGKLDRQSLGGKLVMRLASASAQSGVSTIVLAGQVVLDRSQFESAGILRAYSMADFAGSIETAMSDADRQLELLAAHAANHYTELSDEPVHPTPR